MQSVGSLVLGNNWNFLCVCPSDFFVCENLLVLTRFKVLIDKPIYSNIAGLDINRKLQHKQCVIRFVASANPLIPPSAFPSNWET